jgi:hypothetical protein
MPAVDIAAIPQHQPQDPWKRVQIQMLPTKLDLTEAQIGEIIGFLQTCWGFNDGRRGGTSLIAP